MARVPAEPVGARLTVPVPQRSTIDPRPKGETNARKTRDADTGLSAELGRPQTHPQANPGASPGGRGDPSAPGAGREGGESRGKAVDGMNFPRQKMRFTTTHGG